MRRRCRLDSKVTILLHRDPPWGAWWARSSDSPVGEDVNVAEGENTGNR